MHRFITVARLTTNPSQVEEYAKFSAFVPAEFEHIQKLRAEKKMGFVHLALEQGTVFLEVFAENLADAQTTLAALPLAPWMQFEIYPSHTPEEARERPKVN
jgi:hypothetical protein